MKKGEEGKKKSFWETAFNVLAFESDMSRDGACRKALLIAVDENNEEAVLQGLETFLQFRSLNGFRINTLKVLMTVGRKLPELDAEMYAEAEKKGYIPFNNVRKVIFKEVTQSFAEFTSDDKKEEADECFTFLVDIYNASYLTVMAGVVCKMIEDALKESIKNVQFEKLERWMISLAVPRRLNRVLSVVWTRNGGHERLGRMLNTK